MNSIDYGKHFFLFHWISASLRIMNLVSESLKIIFFIEGERALGWCFLDMSALKSSWQKSKLQTAIPLPLATNWFFCFSPRRWNLAFFSLCMVSSHPLTWPRDISALLPRPAFGLQILYGVVKKKVNHKREEKMHPKVKMTSQRAENLVQVQQHHGKHFYKKIFF